MIVRHPYLVATGLRSRPRNRGLALDEWLVPTRAPHRYFRVDFITLCLISNAYLSLYVRDSFKIALYADDDRPVDREKQGAVGEVLCWHAACLRAVAARCRIARRTGEQCNVNSCSI